MHVQGKTKKKFLTNKTVLVTGGGGGIGWGICLECAREGARVIVTDVADEKGKEVLNDLLEVSDGHQYLHLDLLKLKDFDKVLKKAGDIDVLINNAGINTPNKLIDMTEKNWDRVQGVNLKGHVFLTQRIAKKNIKNKKKLSIIFISSIHQDIVQGRPHYSSSKAAINMLVKELAVEFAPHDIRVNGIAPGGIYISEKVEFPDGANDEPTVLLGGKNGIPRDIGRAVVFLASSYWSRHITGQVLTVSGGQHLKP